ncbi:MAG: class I SAM-dependent rRNA methyltransferase [Clostridia bacterium]|nr:class I SAM-dependent rRNA methyltransferase [Clostridia bacterium]
MKSNRNYPIVTVNKKGTFQVQNGHPWIYGSDTLSVIGEVKNGDIVDAVTEKGTYLGSGLYNENSKILVRILSKNANDRFDDAFFQRRVRYALQYRLSVMGNDTDCFRVIFGDSDGLPGFICDKFGDVLVTQTMSYGMELRKPILFNALKTELRNAGFTVSAIFERNDVAVREKEGLPLSKGYFEADDLTQKENNTVIINENGVKYEVDFENGQKTGFFLDQKYNRLAASKIAPGKNVLDCFTHTGSFALNCAKAGAQSVTALDISADAIASANRNIALNGFTNMQTQTVDVFDYLTALDNEKKKPFDYIILDPPAFTKSGSTVQSAFRGYKEINRRAMHLLPRGGYLATCSCSHFMPEDLFCKMLREAAHDANVSLLQVEARQQAPDHPILWGVPETSYLKFYIFQVL